MMAKCLFAAKRHVAKMLVAGTILTGMLGSARPASAMEVNIGQMNSVVTPSSGSYPVGQLVGAVLSTLSDKAAATARHNQDSRLPQPQ
jgi:hypothetical protein